VNGKPRPVPVAYLGKADDLLARLKAADSSDALRLHSRSHGAVAALWALTPELDSAGIIDGQLAASGRRVSGTGVSAAKAHLPPVSNDDDQAPLSGIAGVSTLA